MTFLIKKVLCFYLEVPQWGEGATHSFKHKIRPRLVTSNERELGESGVRSQFHVSWVRSTGRGTRNCTEEGK
jgi:hypothetical protein